MSGGMIGPVLHRMTLHLPARRRFGSRGPALALAVALGLCVGAGLSAASALADGADPSPASEQPTDPTGELPIGPGDILAIDVFGLDELDRKARVLQDGTISMPHLGAVEVAGLDSRQAAERIARLLEERQLVNSPQVTVFVEDFASRAVSVQGAVQAPGVYQLLSRSSVLDVIGMAGGLSGDEEKRIVILRRSGGQDVRLEVDLERLIEGGELSLNVELLPGDIVMVPRTRMLRVYVTGAVEKPGSVEYSSAERITVLQAITAAGGGTERANLRKVTVTRRLPSGDQERIRVNVRRIQKGLDDDLRLEPNDTVVVGEWLF